MKTGECRYGPQCRFNHPKEKLEPSNTDDQYSAASSAAFGNPATAYNTNGLPLRPVSDSYHVFNIILIYPVPIFVDYRNLITSNFFIKSKYILHGLQYIHLRVFVVESCVFFQSSFRKLSFWKLYIDVLTKLYKIASYPTKCFFFGLGVTCPRFTMKGSIHLRFNVYQFPVSINPLSSSITVNKF